MAAFAQTQISSAPKDCDADKLIQDIDATLQQFSRGASSVASNDDGVAGLVPYNRGFNASLILSGDHDSEVGWTQVTEPDLAFRFNRHFALNLTIPVYTTTSISVAPPTTKSSKAGTATVPGQDVLVRQKFLLGDLSFAGSFDNTFPLFEYTLSATMGAPTGDDKDGLGAGQFTYSVMNHFERNFGGWLTPELELGVGDSSDLLDMRVLKNYTATGANAHFQVGFGFALPWSMVFTADSFENLPLATATVTSTTSNGKKGKQAATITTSTQKSIGEDNGFLSSLDIPVSRHVTVSGYYNHSLRNKTDTAGASITLLLRGMPKAHER